MSESATQHAEAHDYTQTYMAIWGALFVLTIAEVAAAIYMRGAIMVISLVGMAALKAYLVARIYMHLKWEPRKLAAIAAAPVLFLGIFAVFVVLEARSMTDISVHTEEARAEVVRLLEGAAGASTEAAPAGGEGAAEAVPVDESGAAAE